MIERNIPRPLPEGAHGQLPEGAKNEPKLLIRMYEQAMAIHKNDPEAYIFRKGERTIGISPGLNLTLDIKTEYPLDEGSTSHRITFSQRFPDGSIMPHGDIHIDDQGVLYRDVSGIERYYAISALDSFETTNGLEEIDPITGESVPSAFRAEVERDIIAEIDDEAGMALETGFTAVSDQEAIDLLRVLKEKLPSWPEDVTLPEEAEIGQPQTETLDAFKKVVEAMADHEVVRMSGWVDEDGTRYSLSTRSLIGGDGAEIPDDVTFEQAVTETSGKSVSVSTTVLQVQRRGTCRTGIYDQMMTTPSGEFYSPQMFELNSAARSSYRAHMDSPEADASPKQIQDAMQYISGRAAQLIQEQEAKDMASQEPQVGGSVNQRIADQENSNPDDLQGPEPRKGKSK